MAQRILLRFLKEQLAEEVLGDLEEKFHATVKTESRLRAQLNYWYQVGNYLRPFAIKKISTHLNRFVMFQSYFRIGWRNLLKNKSYSFINIGGLAAGMTIAILIGLWLHDELSYNKNFVNYDRLARVMQNQVFNGEKQTGFGQPMQIAPALRHTYDTDFKYVILSTYTDDHKLNFAERGFTARGNFMEPEVTEMLSLTMVKGTRGGLKEPQSILLSETVAKSLFKDEDPLDKMIRVDNQWDLKITGIYKDLPASCSFSDLKIIIPWQLLVKTAEFESRLGWGNNWFQSFAQIADHVNMHEVSAKIKDIKLNEIAQDEKYKEMAQTKPEIFLFPMRDWHLYSEFENGMSVGGKIEYVRLFGVTGIFVLLLACINFMNLSTARSEKRAKEVGIRKSIGSVRYQLVSQFLTESFLIVAFASTVSLLLVYASLPWFNQISNKLISIPWGSPVFWMLAIGFILITGFIAGSYPAFFLSSFHPVKVLKGTFRSGRVATLPRKLLVVVQFSVSIALIIGTVIVFRQIQFAQQRPVGYNQNALISSPIKTDEIRQRYATFREELMSTGAVTDVGASESRVTSTFTTNGGFTWRGKDPDMANEFVTVAVTSDFGKTVQWQLKEGRDFSADMASDSSGFIINEAAARYMGMEKPVGEIMTWHSNGDFKIIGVVKDLVTQSPYSPVKHMIFFLRSQRTSFTNYNVINMRINPSVSTREALTRIESVFKKYDPDNAFDYAFADEEYAKKFNNEKRIAQLASVFAVLAIFISCLGLFGLASFVAEQRTKEIGIRKVLGASVVNLWGMLSKDFVVLVVISCLIAIPIAKYYLENWLQNYEYRTEISIWVFIGTGFGTMIITILTVSFQAIKAAMSNPVNSLKLE